MDVEYTHSLKESFAHYKRYLAEGSTLKREHF